MTRIVFIGGTGRCGTNLMKNILSLHPKVASHPFEYRFIIDPDGIIDFYTTALSCWSPYIIDQKLRRLESFLMVLAKRFEGKEIYVGWELNKHLPGYEEKVSELMDRLVDFKYSGIHDGLKEKRELYFMGCRTKKELDHTLGGFIRDLIDGYLEREGKEVYVEDNTHNILFAREILELLPEAKFIHMVREPKDVIASMSKQIWLPKDKMKTIQWYKDVISQINKVEREIPEKSLIVIDLYELVDNPEKILTEACNFIGIPFNEKLLEADLSRSHRDRWRNEFSLEELNAINCVKSVNSVRRQ